MGGLELLCGFGSVDGDLVVVVVVEAALGVLGHVGVVAVGVDGEDAGPLP